jgi:enoyl-[acyl-carrier protein] reductase II
MVMLRTKLCDLLGIEVPVIQAAVAPFTSPELVAAVSNAGGLGSLGLALTPTEEFQRRLARTQELTSRPFVINHALALFNEEAFQLTLEAHPAAVSFANGDPGDLVKRAHDAGLKVIHQVHTVMQARQAAEREVDIIIAQGGEAGASEVWCLPLSWYRRLLMLCVPSRWSRRVGLPTDGGWLLR